MNRDQWAGYFSGTSIVYGSMRRAVRALVSSRGYGVWYQRDAIATVHGMTPSERPFFDVYEYLDQRYPDVTITTPPLTLLNETRALIDKVRRQAADLEATLRTFKPPREIP